jgi:hypothetical protein
VVIRDENQAPSKKSLKFGKTWQNRHNFNKITSENPKTKTPENLITGDALFLIWFSDKINPPK